MRLSSPNDLVRHSLDRRAKSHKLTLPTAGAVGFLGHSLRTRQADVCCDRDRLTRAVVAWVSPPLHRRRFPRALRYRERRVHRLPERHSSPCLKTGGIWRRVDNSRARITAMRQVEGRAEVMGKYVIATIIRKTDDRLADQFHIVVRSSTIPDDKTIAVSQEDYNHLYPGMLVTVFKVGWGPLSAWWLRR